jgi:hypothetical protein
MYRNVSRVLPVYLALACTTNHPLTVTPDAVQLSQYLEAHPTEDLEVTDTAGHRYWLHDPVVQNDSLIGVKSRAEPKLRRGMPLTEIRGLARSEFDTPKTIGLASGILIGMVTFVAVAIDQPGELTLPAELGGGE